jgi:hypothetical protein
MTAVAHPPQAESAAPGAPAKPAKPKPDPHYLALRNFALSISIFNAFGYGLLGFEQPYLWPVFAILTAYTTEITFEMISAWAFQRRPRFLGNGARGMYEFLLPAHITALAVNMLLYANNQILPVIFGVFVGVAGKHAFQAPVKGRMRHFMNPSNFGIAMSLICFGNWVSIAPPYEFTENANTYFRIMIALIIATAGTVLNTMLTKKVPLIVGWMGGYAIQAFVRHAIWNVALFSALGSMTGVAFVLFSNYMITDPGTTPSRGRSQFMFGGCVAFVYGALMELNITYTLFFALVIVCACRGFGWWGVAFYQRLRTGRAPGSTGLNGEAPARLPDTTDVGAMRA